jgi:hypothetical protein
MDFISGLVPILQEAVWASGLVWMGVDNLNPTWFWTPNHPAHSKSVHLLHYPSLWGVCQGVLDFKNIMVAQYVCKYNFIYIHTKYTIFSALIFTKLTNARVLCVDLPGIHPNQAINVKSMDRNSFIFLIQHGFHFKGFQKNYNCS